MDNSRPRSAPLPTCMSQAASRRRQAANESSQSSPTPSVHWVQSTHESPPNAYLSTPRSRSSSVERTAANLSRSPPNETFFTPPTSPGRESHSLRGLFHRSSKSPEKTPPARRRILYSEERRARISRTIRTVREAITVANVAQETVRVASIAMSLAPVPGLDGASKILDSILEAVQQVDSNLHACLRLTDRCAEILITISEEIQEVGEGVLQYIGEPIKRVTRVFNHLLTFLRRLVERHFWERFMRRDEMLQDIADCETALDDCLNTFNRAMLLRIVARVYEMSPNGLSPTVLPVDSPPTNVSGRLDSLDLPILNLGEDTVPVELVTPEDVFRERIKGLHRRQSERDKRKDMADLRKLLKAAVETDKDEDMVRLLHELLQTFHQDIYGDEEASLASTSKLFDSRTMEPLSESHHENGLSDEEHFSSPGSPPIDWAVNKYTIDLGEVIGRGVSSQVYRGRWRGRVVAVKVLESNGDGAHNRFLNELNIWRLLNQEKHQNVLRLYGASRETSNPPWFFVGPYLVRGGLSDYLRRFQWMVEPDADLPPPSIDFLKLMHDVATGMEFLHHQRVVHGDLKAANVLVDDQIRCVIADFGQSHFISSIRHTTPPPHHAIRWQAPEIMSGRSLLNKKVDVYAFAICCVEIMTMGSLPWPAMHDDLVKEKVLRQDHRPPYPLPLAEAIGFNDTLKSSWHTSPSERPSFTTLVQTIAGLRAEGGATFSPRIIVSQVESSTNSLRSYERVGHVPNLINTVAPGTIDPHYIMPTLQDGGISGPRRWQPQTLIMPEHDHHDITDDHILDATGLIYQQYLFHDFSRSLTHPLWNPGPVSIGDVGYLSQPSGRFVRLFNATKPELSSAGRMRDILEVADFGEVSIMKRTQRPKSFTERGKDALLKFYRGQTPPASPVHVKRKHSFPLSNTKSAHLYSEKVVHQFVADTKACRKWFRAYWNNILSIYRVEHGIRKEDLIFVVETLEARDYALLVNHRHHEVEATFEVFSVRKPGEPWGQFLIPSANLTDVQQDLALPPPLCVRKVSIVNEHWDTVLIARLRFQEGVSEPSLN